MQQSDAAFETSGPGGPGFRVNFGWQDDRYGHQVEAVGVQDGLPLFVSQLASDTTADWPDSPPLQQISWMETIPGERIALLVGMAGKSHWSVSVETDADRIGLLFDVACRVHHTPPWLGSTYRCLCPIQLLSSHEAEFTANDLAGRITTEPTDGQPQAVIQRIDDRLIIQPLLDRVCAPQTVRWKYRIAMNRQTTCHEQ